MTERIGILGGTFDPIHRGHIDLGMAAQSALGLTSVLVVPSNVPPHRRLPVASRFHRFAMVALAVAGRPGWEASDLEIADDTRSYTSSTLQGFHERGVGATSLFFVIGADAFAEIALWKDYPSLLDAAHFAVVSRPGWPVDRIRPELPSLVPRMVMPDQWRERTGTSIILIDAPTADVSATAIRHRCAEGLSVAEMLPPGVLQHLEQHRLYPSPASDRRAGDNAIHPAAGGLHGRG